MALASVVYSHNHALPSPTHIRTPRTRGSRRCWLVGRRLRKTSVRLVMQPLSGFGVCCCWDGKSGSESDVELQGPTIPRLIKEVGVGLLTTLITFAANYQFAGPAFGLEHALQLSQATVTFENPLSSVREAPIVSADALHFTSSNLHASPPSYQNVSSWKEISHNETVAIAAVEDLTPPSECTEEIATSVVPKEEPVEEVSNEAVVQEAWQVVNESFLDARHNSWSADSWLKKKQEVLKTPIRSRMAAYGAIRSMLSSLNDPYTRFLTPDQFSQLSKYDVTGIGLNIGESADASGEPSLKVFGIVLGSPAQLAGVRQGDELLAVGGNSVSGKTAFDAASLIQGPKGTHVSIKIRHGRCDLPLVLDVERQQDVRSPVYYRLERVQDSKQVLGYIHLKEFNALAKRDLVTAMKRMQDAGAASFVLDLRDNPGGLVQAGIEIAKLFLDEGETVIETVGRDPQNFRSILSSNPPLTQAPLTVLVNDHTASASEIVAAALHDNCRALLVGKRTFGKGLIQAVYELSDGSGVVLTVGKYVTPGHQDIDGAGIEPDYNHTPGFEEGQGKLGNCRLLKASSRSPKSTSFAMVETKLSMSMGSA